MNGEEEFGLPAWRALPYAKIRRPEQKRLKEAVTKGGEGKFG